ncbi:MAG: hypothetical protein LBI33_06930 [Propionibacteriaceae bacterium]|jgi:hypothetical protein|nr:hypothetical protein [Propionibacteriaceae bacterium]
MDTDVDAALDYLQEMTRATKSDIIRNTLLQAAERAKREAMRTEALELADDPDDRAEAQAVLAFMGGTDAW